MQTKYFTGIFNQILNFDYCYIHKVPYTLYSYNERLRTWRNLGVKFKQDILLIYVVEKIGFPAEIEIRNNDWLNM